MLKGDNVLVPIPDVDRGRTDPRNLIAVVLDVVDEKFYKLGTTEGTLKQLFTRSQFSKCKEKLLKLIKLNQTYVDFGRLFQKSPVLVVKATKSATAKLNVLAGNVHARLLVNYAIQSVMVIYHVAISDFNIFYYK